VLLSFQVLTKVLLMVIFPWHSTLQNFYGFKHHHYKVEESTTFIPLSFILYIFRRQCSLMEKIQINWWSQNFGIWIIVPAEEAPVDMSPDSGINELHGLTPEEQERQRQEWQQELTVVCLITSGTLCNPLTVTCFFLWPVSASLDCTFPRIS
jgi:hypothetical protein